MSGRTPITLPYNITGYPITLYTREGSSKIYYYFRHENKTYRGSSNSNIFENSIQNSVKVYEGIVDGKKGTGEVRFDFIVSKFLNFKKDRIVPKSMEEYTRQSETLIEYFGTRDIETIEKVDFQNYQEWRLKYYLHNPNKKIQSYKRGSKRIKGCEYHEVGNTTINRELGLLVSILRYSQDERGLLKTQKVPSWNKLPEKRREEILTKEEYQTLEKYWEKENPYYGKIIRFVQNTGIRFPSELIQIQWKNVFLEKKFMVILRKGKPPKWMGVPLVGSSHEILTELKERPGISTNQDDYVFVNDNGTRIKDIRKSWRKGLKECGINKDLSMYSLRHLFTTRMVKTRPDIPLKVISDILGHSDSKMVDKHYSHLRIEDTVHILERSEENKDRIIKKRKDSIEKKVNHDT